MSETNTSTLAVPTPIARYLIEPAYCASCFPRLLLQGAHASGADAISCHSGNAKHDAASIWCHNADELLARCCQQQVICFF